MFAKEKRSPAWKALRDEVRLNMAMAKKAYYDREVEKICGARDKKSLAYTALKNINSTEKPKSWSIMDMAGDDPEEIVLEKLADFFSDVTKEYVGAGLDGLVRTYDRPIYSLTGEMVEERIRKSNKPNSQVPGDFPPQLLSTLAPEISVIVTEIFNLIPAGGGWPREWKKEYQTVIPKVRAPESYDQLRNLSCTNFLSKILESFVIDSIKAEISMSELQYGGLKGCGTDNFLVELWNNVLEGSEDSDNAVALMSIDFSKAFNRLDHGACLKKLSDKNASNQTLNMIFSFLEERTMCVRSGQSMSSFRSVSGGSPQGTKLGNLLFCIAVDDICHDANKRLEGTPERQDIEDAFPEQYAPRITSTPIDRNNDSFNPNPYGLREKKNVINDSVSFEYIS